MTGHPAPRCLCCADIGYVCATHPGRAWTGACRCNGAATPCPACCSPDPAARRRLVAAVFQPDFLRNGNSYA